MVAKKRHTAGKRYKRCVSCGKQSYPSEIVAQDMAAFRMSLEGAVCIISVYECPVRPGSYHITKTNQYRRMLREGRS